MHFRGATSSGERQGERSVALSFERHQLMAQVDTTFRQTAGNSQRQLLVPTHDFPASLRRLENGRTPRRDSRAEQREQVKRTLLARIQAEVPATAALQQPAQRPVVSTFDVLLNPVIHTQIVKPVRRLRIVSVGRWEVDLLRLLLQERSEYLEIPRQFFRTIIAIKEIHNAWHRFPPCQRQFNGSDSKALDQLAQGLMVAVE